MSLRRKSCDACFQGRRKCDLTYPTCRRCARIHKTCHYAHRRRETACTLFDGSSDLSTPSSGGMASDLAVSPWPQHIDQSRHGLASFDLNFELDQSRWVQELLSPSVPNLIGPLGELQPVTGSTRSWAWVVEELRGHPRAFAQRASTSFVHGETYANSVPPALQGAFGVCAAYACVNEANKGMFFHTLEAEVHKLLQMPPRDTLQDELARMQAFVFYQIIRILDGDLKQRQLAAQQKGVLATWGLKLLQKVDAELQNKPRTWEMWIQAESIRRTVTVAFVLHAVHSVLHDQICPEMPTLSILPISTKPALWHSRASYLQYLDADEAVKYPEFTALWLASISRPLDSWEKFLLVACKGLDSVEARSHGDVS